MITTFLPPYEPVEIVCPKIKDGCVSIKSPDGYVIVKYPVKWLLADGGIKEIERATRLFVKKAPEYKKKLRDTYISRAVEGGMSRDDIIRGLGSGDYTIYTGGATT